MDVALKNTPIEEPLPPTGIIQVGNEWYFEEFGPGKGMANLKSANANSEAESDRAGMGIIPSCVNVMVCLLATSTSIGFSVILISWRGASKEK